MAMRQHGFSRRAGPTACISKVQARQGVTGHNVRYVLWFGLAAIIVAFAAIYLLNFY
jgi:hypothetical protein